MLANTENNSLNEQEIIRREKLLWMQKNQYDPYSKNSFTVSANALYIQTNYTECDGCNCSVAGRIMSRRIMGKATFAHIQDKSGNIQVYIRRDEIGDASYEIFKKEYDIGDIIGIVGTVFKTNSGEISIKASKIEMLAKSLRPLPEKHNGLRDIDAKYRHRELDLIMNPGTRDTFIIRGKIIGFLRRYLDELGYLEVDTPILNTIEIGAAARPFSTHHNALNIDMFLRIETELYLKRLIVGGFERVYEIGRIFRNEGMDTRHNPEFTTIEMYQAYANYFDMMDLVEDMYSKMALEICRSTLIPYGEHTIDMSKPWKRLSMVEAVKLYSNEDYNDWDTDEDARAVAAKYNIELERKNDSTKGDVLSALFDEFVEKNLIQPTIIYDYPIEISPLAKKNPQNPLFTQRFEYFINGMEMGNAFSELNDPIDQRERFIKQLKEREAQGISASLDEDFIEALEYGMPPTGGLGLGVDRLCMLLTNNTNIRDVILFPTMKPLTTEEQSISTDKN